MRYSSLFAHALGVHDDGFRRPAGLTEPGEEAEQARVLGLVEHAALRAGVPEQQAGDGLLVGAVEQLDHEPPALACDQILYGVTRRGERRVGI